MQRVLRVILTGYFILFFAFGSTAPVYAEGTAKAVSSLLESAQELVDQFKTPQLSLPFSGKFTISKQFREGNTGVEFKVGSPSAILAVDDGEVKEATVLGGISKIVISHKWGESVYITHLPGVKFHLEGEELLQSGQTITKGQEIGQIDTTILFSIKPKIAPLNAVDGFIDPLPYLPDSLKEDVLGEIQATPEVVVATSPAELFPPVTLQDISQDPDFLYNYKFNLKTGVTAHFFDKATKRPGFAIADQDYNYKLRFFLKESSDSAVIASVNTPEVEGTPPPLAGRGDSSGVRVNGNIVEYPVVVSGIPMTLMYTVFEDKVKEELIIAEKPDSSWFTVHGSSTNSEQQTVNQLMIPFEVQNIGLTQEKGNNSEYTFYDPTGEVAWQLQKPNIKDANGREGEIQGVIANLSEQSESNGEAIPSDNKTYTLTLDTNYLLQATYPVVIDPTVIIGLSSTANATQPSTMNHIVRTSDGIVHAFVQMGTNTTTCGSAGLWWVYSSDNFASQTCGGRLSSDTTNLMYASAAVGRVPGDSTDSVYVVYSIATTGRNDAYDIYYRKLSTVSGSWAAGDTPTGSLGTEVKIKDGSGSGTAYGYATLAIEGTNRLWMATRTYDGTNYGINAYYSGDLNPTASGNWLQSNSNTALDTLGSNANKHYPVIVHFGTNLGVIYNNNNATATTTWRFRADSSDPSIAWGNEGLVTTTAPSAATFSAISDTSGRVYFAVNTGTNVSFFYWNGSVWSTSTTVSSTAASSAFVALSTDNTNVWVFYGDTTGLSGGLSGSRKLVYKKGVAPFTASEFDVSSTVINSYQATFDSVWLYNNAATSYCNATTDAGDSNATKEGVDANCVAAGTGDIAHTTTSGMVKDYVDATHSDIAYFGKSDASTFDAISWDVSTAGVGGVITWEYWNGASWSGLTLTASSAPNFTADGWGAFTPPGDWAKTTVNGEGTAYYYIRARVSTAYTTAPVGIQFDAIPQINWVGVTSTVASNTIYAAWTENATSIARARYIPVSVTASTTSSATAAISPAIAGYSSSTNATQTSTMHNIVRTSDGTLHAFVQGGTGLTCGGAGGNNNIGLNWMYSTDNGSTWICGGQLSSDTTNLMYADARVDNSDNIYAVYSVAANTASASNIVSYRKFTKGSGATWTMGATVAVSDPAGGCSFSASVGCSYATLELEGTTRIWVAARYFDGTNYQVSAYYSNGLAANATWTRSATALDTAGTTNTKHFPTMVRFGTNIGVIYNNDSSNISWRYRADATADLTSWVTESTVLASSPTTATFSAVTDSSGHIYFATNTSTSVIFTYWNGFAWSSSATIAASATGSPAIAASGAFVSLATDGTTVWVYYGDTYGLSGGLSGGRKLVYKKGVSPFAAADFDTTGTSVVSSQNTFDKVWTYISSSYTNDTTDAGSTTTADVAMPSSVNDIIYFGKTTTFDAISYDLSTNGAGGVVAWEYYNGSAWEPLTGYFAVSNSTFAGDGYITFNPHSDWTTTQINSETTAYYYIRARVTTSYSIAPVGVEMDSIPQIRWAGVVSSAASNKMYALWTENAGAPTRIRAASVTYNLLNNYRWKSYYTGLTSSSINGLVIDPNTSTTAYIMMDQSGIYKTTDGGANWTAKSTGITGNKAASWGSNATSLLTMDPNNSSVLYVVSDGYVWKTTDGADTWVSASSGLAACGSSGYLMGVLVDKTNSNHLLTGGWASSCTGGIYESTDAGANWTRNTSYPFNDSWSLGIDPNDAQKIYTASVHAEYRYTTNGGTTWSTPTGLPGGANAAGYSVAIKPNDTSKVFVAASDGIYRSTNYGVSYSQISTTQVSGVVKDIKFAPSDSNTVFAIGASGLFKSTDGGANWSFVGQSNIGGVNLAIHATDPNTVYIGTGANGIYKSTNGGTSFAQVNTGLPSATPNLRGAVIAPSNPNIMYIGVYNSAYYKSSDRGYSWTKVEDDTDLGTGAGTTAVHPTDPSTLYAGYRYIKKSTDGGQNWTQQKDFGATEYIVKFLIDYNDPQIVYAFTTDTSTVGRAYKSTNGGTDWSQQAGFAATKTLNIKAIVMDSSNSQKIYVGTDNGNGIWETSNGGTNWTQVTSGLSGAWVQAIVIDPTNSNIVYAIDRQGSGVLNKSTDSGASFSALYNFGTSKSEADMYDIVVDRSNPDILYSQNYYNSFKSTDGGLTWSILSKTGFFYQSNGADFFLQDATDSTKFYGGLITNAYIYENYIPIFSTSTISASDDNGGTVAAGDTITYTVTATNSGPGPATSPQITVTIPSGLTYVANSTTIDSGAVVSPDPISGSTLTIPLGTLNRNDSTSIGFQVTIDSGVAYNTSIPLSATVSSYENSVGTATNTSTITVGDSTSPSGSTNLSSSDHTVSTWSTDNTVTVNWTSATDTDSGLAGYSYTFDTTADTTPNTTQDIGTVTTVASGALSDGNAHYFHIRAVDSHGNWGNATHLGPFYIDSTIPVSFDLDSPGNDSSINTERPTFKWKEATDVTSGLSSYSLEADGNFSIMGIPTSRNIDYDTSKYLAHYDNGYISLYTKSSMDWRSGENDGKIKEGSIHWTVKAIDNAGNQRSESRAVVYSLASTTSSSTSRTTVSSSNSSGGNGIITQQQMTPSQPAPLQFLQNNLPRISLPDLEKKAIIGKGHLSANLNSFFVFLSTISENIGHIVIGLVPDFIKESTAFLGRIRIGFLAFADIVFDKSPTAITQVTIEEIGKDYAVISWKTNHYTSNNKVNYGPSVSYGSEVWGENGEKTHQVKVTGLKPGQRYFFEVMSQGENYTFDAYYSFVTNTQ